MKLPQLLLSMQSIHSISPRLRLNTFPSLIRPLRTRNLSELVRYRNVLLPRDVRVRIPERVPVLNIWGERLPWTPKYNYHPSHHLLPLFHAAKIDLLSQQLTEGCGGSRCLCCLDRCVSFPL